MQENADYRPISFKRLCARCAGFLFRVRHGHDKYGHGRYGFVASLVLLFGLLPVAGLAQTAPAVSSAPHLSAAQAQQLLSVLDDDAKRQQFVTTLKNLAVAQGSAAQKAGGTPAAAPAGNLGAQTLQGLSHLGEMALQKVGVIVKTISNFRALGPWVRHVWNSSALQTQILSICVSIAVMVGVGIGLSYCLRFLFHKPRTLLEDRAKQRSHQEQKAGNTQKRALRAETELGIQVVSSAEGTDEAPSDDTLKEEAEANAAARLRRQSAMTRLMMIVRRFPYALGCFVLDLLCVLMFPLAATLIQLIGPHVDAQITGAMQSVAWIASAGLGLWLALLRTFLAPKKPWLRLTTFGDQTALFLFYQLRRIGIVISWGVTGLIVLTDCSVPGSTITALSKLLALVVHILVAIMILQARAPVTRACNRAIENNTKRTTTTLLSIFAKCWWIAALFFDFALWLVWALEIQGGYQGILHLFVVTCVVLIVIRLISIVLYGALERSFHVTGQWKSLSRESQTRITRYYSAAQRVLSVLIGLSTVIALAVAWGAPIKALFGHHGIGSQLLSSLSTIIIALLIGVVIWEAANAAIERHIRRLDAHEDSKARVARVRTLQPMLRILLLTILGAIIGLTILSEIGVNTAPLLASASIFGVALGFGSQKLVQDFISGIFLLMENALTVGDAVTLNGTYGIVEKLSLRTVHVRANDGSMNIFPFSSLGQIINYNRDFARAMIVANVGYSSDTDDAVKALKDITAGMRADPEFKSLIIDDFQLWGVDSLNDSSVTIRGTLPTTTAGRWPVQRQFYRRMKKCFQERGIDLPFPTQTLNIPALEERDPLKKPPMPKGKAPSPSKPKKTES